MRLWIFATLLIVLALVIHDAEGKLKKKVTNKKKAVDAKKAKPQEKKPVAKKPVAEKPKPKPVEEKPVKEVKEKVEKAPEKVKIEKPAEPKVEPEKAPEPRLQLLKEVQDDLKHAQEEVARLQQQAQVEETAKSEQVFIPDLAKVKFVRHKPKQKKNQATKAACPCAQAQTAGESAESEPGKPDARLVEALNDPNYVYMKLVPIDSVPEEGSPEAACPLFVIPKKDEESARTCLKALKQLAEDQEVVEEWTAGEEESEPAPDANTGTFVGDVKQAVKNAADRQAKQPATQPEGKQQPKVVLQAKKTLETEVVAEAGEGIGAM